MGQRSRVKEESLSFLPLAACTLTLIRKGKAMKAAIVFHSICGNTYLMAKMFEESFKAKGVDISLYRVKDDSIKELAQQMEPAKDNLDDILALPEAKTEDLLDKDLVVMGSPTYYGNVSAELKKFMDVTCSIWVEGKYQGKRLGAFTSAGNSEGGGDQCLQAIHRYGIHMGMLFVPNPPDVTLKVGVSAYGVMHYSGPGTIRPDEKIKTMIDAYVDILVKA
jgi:NAD(P)H dehydrogenase (quinone)